MRIIFSILIILLSENKLAAQNLVPNPGFELVNDCSLGSFDYPIEGFISDWFTFNYSQNTVDVFHTCFNVGILQPPNTVRGYSYPQNGDGMIGLAYAKEENYQEVISVKLTQQLVKDSAYCVSFWVKNSKIENMQYWVEYVGLLFTEDTITPFEIHNIDPHLKSKIDLSKNEWIEIEGYYVASGNEKFANIGFIGPPMNKSQSVPYQVGTSFVPYYFFDEVTITMCNKDSLLNVVLDLPNVLTLNDNAINELYLIGKNNIKSLDIQVFNRWGNKVREYDGVNDVWNGTDDHGNPLSAGVYFINANAETTFGDIISKSQYVHLVRP